MRVCNVVVLLLAVWLKPLAAEFSGLLPGMPAYLPSNHIADSPKSLSDPPTPPPSDGPSPRCNAAPFWDTSGRPRKVLLARFSSYKGPKDRPWRFRDHWRFERSTGLGHNEVFVGDTAYSIYGYNEEQRIDVRAVEKSYKAYGYYLHSKIPFCTTTRTDDEIKEFLRQSWTGAYCSLEKNCRVFSNALIGFLCPKKRIPWYRRKTEIFLRSIYKGYHRLDRAFMGRLFSNEKSWWKRLGRKFDSLPRRHDPSNTKWEFNIVTDYEPGPPRPSCSIFIPNPFARKRPRRQ